MLAFFIVLAMLSALVMATGFVFSLSRYGETSQAYGEAVGREMVRDLMADRAGGGEREAAAFRGHAAEAGREAEFNLAEIKQAVRAGRWGAVWPVLAALGGLLGLLIFGSWALMLGVENRLVGLLIVAAATYATVRTLWALARA